MFKKVHILLLLLGLFNNLMSLDYQFKEAFIVYSDSKYISFLEPLLDSIKTFSTRSVIIYTINCDYKVPDKFLDRVKTVSLNLNISKDFGNIYTVKPYCINHAIENCFVKYGIYLDADSIVNYSIDSLFNKLYLIDSVYPIVSIHSHDPKNYYKMQDYLGLKDNLKVPYVHAAPILFSYKSAPFLKEWSETCRSLKSRILANWDETILNILLRKYDLSKENIMPDVISHYCRLMNYINQVDSGYSQVYHIIHGAKDSRILKKILDLLLENRGLLVSESLYNKKLSRNQQVLLQKFILSMNSNDFCSIENVSFIKQLFN